MIDSIRAWINGSWTDRQEGAAGRQEGLQLALTALLIEAANCDDRFDERERGVIARLLESRFSLSRSDANQLLAAGEAAASESTELFHFTRIINDRLSFEERVELIDLFGPNGMGHQPHRKRPAQFLRVDRPAGEDLGSGDEHGHDALLAVSGPMVRLPSASTAAVVPPGMTTVVVGTSTIAGPVSRCPARRCR